MFYPYYGLLLGLWIQGYHDIFDVLCIADDFRVVNDMRRLTSRRRFSCEKAST